MFKLKPILIFLLAVCLTACVSDGEYSVISNDTYSRLTVSANASAEDISFPVVISAYDADGNKATQQELTSHTSHPVTAERQLYYYGKQRQQGFLPRLHHIRPVGNGSKEHRD